VVERFSHWEYGPDSVYVRDRTTRLQDVVVGDADAMITAVYLTDFTTLAVLVLSTATAVGVYAYREEIRTILEAYRKRV
jgi:endonuclease/exonuclease/phosphatase (EEP) superfamily protein YafD